MSASILNAQNLSKVVGSAEGKSVSYTHLPLPTIA